MTGPMTKTAAIEAVIGAAAAVPIVFTTGYTSRIAHAVADRPNHFYMTGSMGLCAPVASGLALATGHPAVAVDGDGSLLMNPAALVAAGALGSLPLVHVVLDDEAYDSTGGQDTGSSRVDLCAWALAAGYLTAGTARTPAELASSVAAAVATTRRPALIRCPVTTSGTAVPARIGADLAVHALRFTATVTALTKD